MFLSSQCYWDVDLKRSPNFKTDYKTIMDVRLTLLYILYVATCVGVCYGQGWYLCL